MDGLELRATLGKLSLTQAQLARQLDVTPRALTAWLSGARPVPGPVEAYLRLFTNAPENVRDAEVQRIPESTTSMREGMYSVEYYSDNSGRRMIGYGFIVFEAGSLYGGDPIGGKYNGSYVYNEATGLAAVHVKVTFPPGGMAVFGVSLPYEWTVSGKATFAPSQALGSAILTLDDGHTVNVAFRFIRELPEAA